MADDDEHYLYAIAQFDYIETSSARSCVAGLAGGDDRVGCRVKPT